MPGTPFQTRALSSVDLDIHAGEVLGLVGATGSGKSTFLQAICGLIDIAAGTVEYPGGFDAANLHSNVGMVFQMPEDQLFERTVLEDVSFGPRQLGWPSQRVADASRRALERVGLDPDTYGKRCPLTLSGGEKRRVAIAGILSMEPRLLLLDEPTAGLDCRGRRYLVDLITGLHREGTTIVIVTHDLEYLSGLATRVVVFQKGRVVSVGGPKEILGETEALRRAGLRAPVTAELLAALSGRGFSVPNGLLAVDETVQAIEDAFGDKGRRSKT